MSTQPAITESKHPAIRDEIRRRICRGDIVEQLPSIRSLADEFGVHGITVTKAVDALVREGLVRSVPRKGYFVVRRKVRTVLMLVYGVAPTWNIVFLPLLVLLALVTALGVSLWLSALNVLYRDVQYIIPFLIQLWMFISPVVYPASRIDTYPGWVQVIYNLNPMTAVIGGFRWALLGQQSPNQLVGVSAAAVLAVFVGGVYYFRRMERIFADVV